MFLDVPSGQVAFSVSLWGLEFWSGLHNLRVCIDSAVEDLFLGLWSVSRISICRMIDGKTGAVGRVRKHKQELPVPYM